MRVEICIAKEKITKMPNGAVDALKEELTRRISKRYDDVEVIVKATSNDGLSVTRTADKDSAKTFVQETLKDTWSLLTSGLFGNDSNLLIVFYVQIMPDDFVMQLHRF